MVEVLQVKNFLASKGYQSLWEKEGDITAFAVKVKGEEELKRLCAKIEEKAPNTYWGCAVISDKAGVLGCFFFKGVSN